MAAKAGGSDTSNLIRCEGLALFGNCRSEDGPGFKDALQLDRQTLMVYTGHLLQKVEQGALPIATVQKRLSSVNQIMVALYADQYVKVASPSKVLGMQRTSVRRSVPQGQDREHVKRVVEVLCGHRQSGAGPSLSWHVPARGDSG